MFKTQLLFEDGKDIVFFKTFEEMEDKYNYYINNEKKRVQIALAGYKKVRRFHNADLRAIRLAQLVLHHANGGKFNPEFNDINRFNNTKRSKLFPVTCMIVNDQLYQAIPHMHEYEAEAFSSCFNLFDQPIRVLEWGSGNSTLYFSKYLQNGSQWDSVEHSSAWAKRGKYLLENLSNSNINVHFVPSNREYQEGSHDGDIQTFRNYVLFPMQLNTQFQVIIVDGRARVECMKVGWYLLKKNGVMVLHDAQRQEYKGSIPVDSFYLRLVNTRINIEGNVTLLFICKRADTISKIIKSLENRLPQYFRFDSNIDDFLMTERLDDVSKFSSTGSDESNVEENNFVPQVFTIETTLACNLQCPECAIGGDLIVRPKSYMNLEQFKIIAEKIQPFVKLCYLFNWGEPLLNPDIIKIIKHSSEKFNASLCISTNGILVNDKTALELITSGISTIIVSIDGITQAVYEKYRKKGDLKKAIVGLEMLQRHNLKLGNRVEILPQFIVFKHNQHEMEGFRSHCTSIGLRPLFKSPYLRNESKFENSDYPEFIRNQYPDINSLRQAMKDCPDTRNSFVINSDGAVVGCCYDHNGCSSYGNIYKQDVIEIWNGDKFKKFRERVLSGNAPKFCVENCLYYVADNSCGKKMINNSCDKKNSQMPNFNVHQDQIRHPLFDFPIPPEEKNILKRNNIQKRKKINFSIAFLTTYYDGFIKKIYKEKPELANGRYDLQLSEILDQSFGDSDFYAEGMKSAGWKAADYIMNCQPMQKMWAKEKQIKGSEIEIIYEQIRNSQPDVLYCQDMNLMPEKFLAAVRKYTKLVVGQIATPIRTQIPFHCYDIVFSSFPHYVERFRKSGVTTYYQPLAFENRILDKLQTVEFSNRKYPCVFVGGISNLHIESYKLLDALARMTPIEFWGYGVETTANDSQVRIRHHGEAWGLEMFNILASSKIIINRHGEVAENYANNMRLFEATGCGALLITDYKDNLNELFKVGEEIVAYRSPEECVALVKYYLSNPGEAAQIARAGQNRTLRDHTYWKRMYKSAEILERHLRYKEEKDIYPVIKQISYGHKPIPKDMLTENLSMAWKDPSIPVKQRAVVQNELTGMYRGQPPNVYRVLANCLFPIAPSECTILEIGCASGYYYEALEYLLNKQLNYAGVDYSEPLIVMAKDLYPNTAFYVADGAQLPFEDKRFFISISSGMLLHVPNYVEHIKEAARVSARYIIAHRTPVCRRQKTQHLKKFAYGVETVELIFNEKEIISEFQLQGLKLLQADEYYSNHNQDHYEVTYLFEKEDRLKSHTSRERDRSDTIALPQKIKKPKMLNLGCGGRYHKDWINIDFNSSGPDVIKHNLCLGIPSPNEDFDVVYHSDILEHFPKSYAPEFLKECWRVLKPGGIIRVVQPDLEQIVRLYLDALDRSLQGDQEAQKRYDWLVIELLDQMVRNRSGGEMLEYWKQAPMPAEDFVIKRCGSEVLGALQFLRAKPQPIHRIEDPYLKAIRYNDGSQIKKMSLFRMSGEVHQWMYDRYSLKKMLGETGFVDIQQCCADQSRIPDFNSYLLDIEPNGNVRKPDSFFMEARKQI